MSVSGKMVEQRFRMRVAMGSSACDGGILQCRSVVNLVMARASRHPFDVTPAIGVRAALRTDAHYHFEFVGERPILVSPTLLQSSGGEGRPDYNLHSEHRARGGTLPCSTDFFLELAGSIIDVEVQRRRSTSPLSPAVSSTSSSSTRASVTPSSASSFSRSASTSSMSSALLAPVGWFALADTSGSVDALLTTTEDRESTNDDGCLPTRGRYGLWSVGTIDLHASPAVSGLVRASSRGPARRRRFGSFQFETSRLKLQQSPLDVVDMSRVAIVTWSRKSADYDAGDMVHASAVGTTARDISDHSDSASDSDDDTGSEDSPSNLEKLRPPLDAAQLFANDVEKHIGSEGEFCIESPEALLTCRVRLRRARNNQPMLHIIGIALTVLVDNELCSTLAACFDATSIAALTSSRSMSPELPNTPHSARGRRPAIFENNVGSGGNDSSLRRRSFDDDDKRTK